MGKNSKLDVGSMPGGWEMRTLGEVCEYSKIQNKHKNLPYVGLENIESDTGKFIGLKIPQEVKSNTFYFSKDNVLYGRLRPYLNKVLIPDFDGHCSTEIFPILVNQNYLNRKYLFFWLISDIMKVKIDMTSTGARMPRADMNKVLNFPIPIPPIQEQERIVGILDRAFSAIDQARANVEKNLKSAKELFESYLNGIFAEPGKEELTAQHHSFGSDAGQADERRSTQIKKGWEVKKLGDCFKLKSGDGLIAKNMNQSGSYPVYGGNGIAGHHEEFNLNGSNLIVGRVGALCGNVRHINEKIWLTDNAFKVVDFKINFNNDFLCYLLNFKNLRRYARQAAQPVISNSSLNDVELFFPISTKEQQAIVQKLDALRVETQRLESLYKQKLSDLNELKKSILDRAFRGQL